MLKKIITLILIFLFLITGCTEQVLQQNDKVNDVSSVSTNLKNDNNDSEKTNESSQNQSDNSQIVEDKETKVIETKNNTEQNNESKQISENQDVETQIDELSDSAEQSDETDNEDLNICENHTLSWKDDIMLDEFESRKVFFWLKVKYYEPYIFLKDSTPVLFHYDSYRDVTDSLVYRKVYDDYNSTYYSGIHEYNRDKESFYNIVNNEGLYYVNYYNKVKLVKDAKETELKIEDPYQELDFDKNLIAYSDRDNLCLFIVKDKIKEQITENPVRDIRVIDNRVFYFNESNQLCSYNNGDFTVHQGISENYQVLNNDLYYVDIEENLYRYDLLNYESVLIEDSVEKIVCDNDYLYFIKKHQEWRDTEDELYRVNRNLKEPEFVTVVEFCYINAFFTFNNKIYVGWMEDHFISYVRCFTPIKEDFGKEIIFENDKYLMFYINYIQYEGGNSEVFVYDKLSHKIVHRFHDWVCKDIKIVDNYIYFRSNMANIYRLNIENLENETIYEGIEYSIESSVNYIILDKDHILVSQPDFNNDVTIYKVNIKTKAKQNMNISGKIITDFNDKVFFVDDAIYYYDVKNNNIEKISSNFDDSVRYYYIRLIFEDDSYFYLTSHQEKGELIRVNKRNNDVEVIVNDADKYTRWVYHNQYVYYKRENQIICFNLNDFSKIVRANECNSLFSEKVYKNNKVYVLYRTTEDETALLELK